MAVPGGPEVAVRAEAYSPAHLPLRARVRAQLCVWVQVRVAVWLQLRLRVHV